MKRFLEFGAILLIIILFCDFGFQDQAQGAPFLRCDQYVSGQLPDYFKVFIDTDTTGVQSMIYVYPSETGPALHYDLASLSAGQHTVKVQACKAGDVWGPEVCSPDSSPFSFTKPVPAVSPNKPVNIVLSAQ